MAPPRVQMPVATTALAAALALAVPGAAGADAGDIDGLAVDDELLGSAEAVEVSGAIRCAAVLDYGLLVKATQPAGPQSAERPDAPAEGVGAFGPSGTTLQDDQPCGPDLTDFDVVVQRNRGSDLFSDSDRLAPPANMTVLVMAGSSAVSGGRGSGPIVGDLEYVLEDVSFRLRR